MTTYHLNIEILESTYCVCKGLPTVLIQDLSNKSSFFSFTKTTDEFSVVCEQHLISDYLKVTCEKDWKILKILGPLEFTLVGILSNISSLLAEANISLFTISTYDTDYILVKEKSLLQAIHVLEKAGHTIKN
jgi:hypothetical protein